MQMAFLEAVTLMGNKVAIATPSCHTVYSKKQVAEQALWRSLPSQINGVTH